MENIERLIEEKETQIELLESEVEELEEKLSLEERKAEYKAIAAETKAMMDSFVEAGFKRHEAFQLAKEVFRATVIDMADEFWGEIDSPDIDFDMDEEVG